MKRSQMRVVVCETCSELNMTRNNFKGSGFNCNRCFLLYEIAHQKVLPKQGGFGGCKSDSEITYLNGLPPSEGNPSTDRAKYGRGVLLTHPNPMVQCIRNKIPPETEEVCTNLKSPPDQSI